MAKEALSGGGVKTITEAELAAMNLGSASIAKNIPTTTKTQQGPMLDNANFESDVAAQVAAATPATNIAAATPEEATRESGKFQVPTATAAGKVVTAGEGDGAGAGGGVIPGSGGAAVGTGRTLALDTFRNTFALVFGSAEASKAYVSKLYDLVSGFYKTGSTIDESLNLALYQAKNEGAIPEFTKRFEGLFALDKMFKEGKAVSVPTIAEFFAAEAKMGEVLNQAGLGDLATQDFLSSVIGTGKSVAEVGNIISDVFNTIDNAPKSLKDTLSTYFPGVDRTSIARALLTGAEGAAALAQKVKKVSVISAAGTQGLDIGMDTAADIAGMGYGYNEALTGFGQVARELPTLQKITEMETGRAVKATDAQAKLQSAVFGKDIQEQMALEAAAQREQNRFRGQSGTIGSKTLASQIRGMV